MIGLHFTNFFDNELLDSVLNPPIIPTHSHLTYPNQAAPLYPPHRIDK